MRPSDRIRLMGGGASICFVNGYGKELKERFGTSCCPLVPKHLANSRRSFPLQLFFSTCKLLVGQLLVIDIIRITERVVTPRISLVR